MPHYKQHKAEFKNLNKQLQLQLKDKVIDEMAKRIKEENCLIKEWCNTQNCTYEINKCNEECIKQYFINKAKKEM